MNWPVNNPYPVGQLPSMLQNLVHELHQNTQAPIELIAPAVLGMASLVCQNSIDVRRPNCAPSSCSLYLLTIAGSGEGKSTVANILSKAIHEFEACQAQEKEQQLIKYEADQLAWDAEHKVLLAAIKKLKKKNESVEEVKSRLVILLANKPTKPKAPKLIYDDVTPEAVVFGLCEVWPSAAIVADEGGNFFNGRSSQDFPTWNKAWDGRGLTVDRRGAGTISQDAPRCCILVSIQDAPFRRFYERRGKEALESGFLPRFLVSSPPPTRGTRFLVNKTVSWQATEKYNERVKAILNENAQNVERGKTDRIVLEFSIGATERWRNAYNKVESLAAPGQYLSDIQGYAAKICDNIARVAAIFHFFEGMKGNICDGTVEKAIEVCQWHADEFKSLFSSQSSLPPEQMDAELLENWLLRFVWRVGRTSIPKNDVRQYGPNVLRNKIRLDNALNYLIWNGRVFIGIDNKKAKFVNLNVHHFGNIF